MSTITFSEATGSLADLNSKLGGENGSHTLDGLKKFLRGDNPFVTAARGRVVANASGIDWSDKWECRNDVIYTTLQASDGTTGPQWIERLKSRGQRVCRYTKGLLRSADFKPTTGIIYHLAIIRPAFFSDAERITYRVLAEGKKRLWNELHPEAICLLREKFSDELLKRLGVWYITGIHEPLKLNAAGTPHFLCLSADEGGRYLTTIKVRPDMEWDDEGAFAWSTPAAHDSGPLD